jgi:hypothetical protein
VECSANNNGVENLQLSTVSEAPIQILTERNLQQSGHFVDLVLNDSQFASYLQILWSAQKAYSTYSMTTTSLQLAENYFEFSFSTYAEDDILCRLQILEDKVHFSYFLSDSSAPN